MKTQSIHRHLRRSGCALALWALLAGATPADVTRDAREYEKQRRKAHALYSDPAKASFRREVDEAYRQRQREHSEYALAIQAGPRQAPLVAPGADRLRVEGGLYDNPLAQEYLNRLGQSIVPPRSKHAYAFRIILSPYPEARALSTGAIHISTGLLSLVENESQLAYILGHEIAHIERNHWFEDVMVEKWVQGRRDRQSKTTRVLLSVANSLADPFSGWFGIEEAFLEIYARHGLPSLLKLATPKTLISWDKVQEDEADQHALFYLRERGYEPGEVKALYARLRGTAVEESRLRFGFTATPERIAERLRALDAEPIAPRKAIAMTTSPAFGAMLAAIRRDNGIRAFHADLFAMARANLQAALAGRSDDAAAWYYLGRVLHQTARDADGRLRAREALQRAVSLDAARRLPEARLHLALSLVDLHGKEPRANLATVRQLLQEYERTAQPRAAEEPPAELSLLRAYLAPAALRGPGGARK